MGNCHLNSGLVLNERQFVSVMPVHKLKHNYSEHNQQPPTEHFMHVKKYF